MSIISIRNFFSPGSGPNAKWDNNLYFGFIQQFFDDQIKGKIQKGIFSVPEGTISNRQEMIKKVIENKIQLLGNQVMVLNAWTYKTPLSQKQYTSLIFFHEYVVLKLQVNKSKIYYCTIEKNQVKIQIVYHISLQKAIEFGPDGKQKVQIKKRYQSQYWKPIKLRQIQVCVNYFDLIRYLYKSEQNKKGYHLLKKNCQIFCDEVISFLSNPTKK